MIINVLGHPHLQPSCTQSRKSWRKSTSQLKTSRGGSKNWKFSNPIHPQRRLMLLWRFQLNKSSLAVRNNSQNVRLLYKDAFIFLFQFKKDLFGLKNIFNILRYWARRRLQSWYLGRSRYQAQVSPKSRTDQESQRRIPGYFYWGSFLWGWNGPT